MSFPLIFVLIGISILIIFLKYIEPMINKYKLKNDNEYGSASFSTIYEIKRNFKKENLSNIKRVGVPIYYSKNIKYVWFDTETPHYIYLGSSGSGKSVTAVIPMVTFLANAKEKRSIFVTDPKGEIFHNTSKMLKDNGYNILTIDFRNPDLSNHINILEPIICEYEKYIEHEKLLKVTNDKEKQKEYNNISLSHYAESNRLISSLAAIIMQEKVEGKDPFWNNSARNLLEGLISFFLEEYKEGKIKREQITMTSIRKFQTSMMNDKNERKFKILMEQKPYGTKSKDTLTPLLSMNENTYKSVTGVFNEKMAIFDDINVANITAQSDFELNILGRKPTALFIIVPDEDKIYYTLVTIIIGLIYKELVKLANKNTVKKLDIEIDWLLDEFANCPPIADIESVVSVSRSRGMRFHFFIQSFAQLDNVYGKEVSQIILDNCGLIYLKTNTMDTAEAVSKRLGKQTIESSSISQSIQTISYNGNQSTSLMARDLLTPDEVKSLHYKTIIFPNVGYPIFRDTVIFNKINCYKPGEVIREIRPLKNLTSTYYTIDAMNSKKENSSLTSNNDFSEFQQMEKQILQEGIDTIKNILNNKIEKIEYKELNMRTYVLITLKDKVETKNKSIIKGKINNKKYHLEFNNIDNRSLIELHLKSLI